MTCPYETSIGPFVLGTLDPGERTEVAEHVETCARCQQVRDRFAGLPGLLSRLSLEDVASPPEQPDEEAYERLLAAASSDQARRRHRRSLFAVAAAVVLVVAVGAGFATNAALGGGGAQSITREAVSGPIRAQATVADTQSGSRLTVELAGVRPGERCRLVAVDRSGHRDVAGSWVANYEGWAKITSTTSVTPSQLNELLVETFDGDPLVMIPMHGLGHTQAPRNT